MTVEIETVEAYRRALARIGELRSAGANAETDSELAELEGAVAAYVERDGEPDEEKGRPDPD